MNKLVSVLPLFLLSIPSVFATTCIESITCLPTSSPMQVWQIFDIQFGAGFTLVIMALVLGSIEIAIYMRIRSLAMLAVLGIYTIAAFSAMVTNPLISSQYHIAVYVIIMAAASAGLIMVLKLVKE